jgi:hypothetical protein
MPGLTIRLTDSLSERIGAMAREQGLPKAEVARRVLEAATSEQEVPPVEPLTEDELLELLAASARRGNVAAIRSLLIRTEADPQRQAPAALEALAQERRQ